MSDNKVTDQSHMDVDITVSNIETMNQNQDFTIDKVQFIDFCSSKKKFTVVLFNECKLLSALVECQRLTDPWIVLVFLHTNVIFLLIRG